MPVQYRSPGVPDGGARPPAIGAGGVIPLDSIGGGSTPAAADDGGNPFIPDVIENLGVVSGKAAAWTRDRNNWIRVAKVGIGSVMIIVGLTKLTAPAVGTAAATVAPVGKILKGAGK